MAYTRHLEAPDHLLFWSGIATIAGALRGKVWLDMGYWKWRPNFFIIFVAPPGIATKSTTIGVGLELLQTVEGVHFGPDSATWQGITDAFLESTERVHLPEGEFMDMSAITVAASELGTFLDPRNREMIDVLVDLWDGRAIPWKRRTKGEGMSQIPNPWFNFIGATTPGWLKDNMPEYVVTGGLSSRTVFLFANKKRQYVSYPKLRIADDDRALRLKLIKDLTTISNITGEYELTQEAYEWGDHWYKRHWASPPEYYDHDRLAGYLARKQTHVHKAGLVLAAAERDTRIIEARDLETAEALLTAIEKDTSSVFQEVSDNPYVKYAKVVLLAVKMHPKGVQRRALWRNLMHQMTMKDFDAALNGAVEAGYISLHDDGTDIKLVPTALALEDKDGTGTNG